MVILYRYMQLHLQPGFSIGDDIKNVVWSRFSWSKTVSAKTGRHIPVNDRLQVDMPVNDERFYGGTMLRGQPEKAWQLLGLKELFKGRMFVLHKFVNTDDFALSDVTGDLSDLGYDSREMKGPRYEDFHDQVKQFVDQSYASVKKSVPIECQPNSAYAHIRKGRGVVLEATGHCVVCKGPSRWYRYSEILNGCRCFMKKNSRAMRRGVYRHEEMEHEQYLAIQDDMF